MQASEAQAEPAAPAVSVVVATSGRVDLLDRCLDALLRQSLEGRRYEIIVVDHAPSDRTRQLVAVWRASASARGPGLAYVPHRGPHGAAAARNRGWRAARAPLVAFTTDDAVPSPGWLRHALAAFDDHADVLCGQVDIPLAGLPTAHQHEQRRRAGAVLSLANCLFRKQVLEQLGGFDERFRCTWREACDLHFRLLGLGAAIVRAPQALVVRPLRTAPWGAVLAELRDAAFDALLYKKHPVLYRKTIRATPHWDDAATVAFLLAALLALALGARAVALAGAAAWLGMTALLCARRLRGTARSAAHVTEVVCTSVLMPPLALYWRLAGAIRYRVRFA
jgi:GT2 family glycosyltransferase